MHITEGEGMGSLVETHATPLGLGSDGRPRTMVTEATIAYSDRPGFQVARWLSPLVRPGIRHTARKLWVDDLAYAERRLSGAGAANSPADFGPEEAVQTSRKPVTLRWSLQARRLTFLIRMDLLESDSRIDFSPTVN